MSKKNNLARRKRQHDFEIQREKEVKEKKEKKLHANKNKMKVDGGANKKKRGSGFQMKKKKVKTKLTALTKAKVAQAMDLDKFGDVLAIGVECGRLKCSLPVQELVGPEKALCCGCRENTKKAGFEAKLKQMEEQLEKKRADYGEKMKNKVALIHKEAAEEKTGTVEARRAEQILKAEETAAKCRATGQIPKKLFGCF